MNKSLSECTVTEILEGHCDEDLYLDYVRRAYGQFTIPQLLAKIEKSQPVGCFNRHERDNTSFLACPTNQVDAEDGVINSLCSHQLEGEVEDIIGEPTIVHKHAAGLYRAGVYVLEELGRNDTGVSHDMITDIAHQLLKVDHPCYLEYSRFTKHTLRQPLEKRDAERAPTLRTAMSLPVLQKEVNALKAPCAGPMNAIRNAVAAALQQLLQEKN